MAYKVYPIEGVRDVPNANYCRTPEEVAADIEGTYSNVAALSGKVIAGHTCATSYIEQPSSILGNNVVTKNYLFLVAEFPDASEA